MHNMYRGGTPDVWYSGPRGDLWVEYKWIPRVPKRGTVVPELSALQLDWLTKRKAEGRNVMVIVGAPGGGVEFCTPEFMREGLSAELFAKIMVSDKMLAFAIQVRCA